MGCGVTQNQLTPILPWGGGAEVNASGSQYVAYIWAHDPAPSGMIQFGSYVGNGTGAGPAINLGWVPQFLMFKRATIGAAAWRMYDTARGIAPGSDEHLFPNLSASSGLQSYVDLTSNGFQTTSNDTDGNGAGNTYIYMAIRRAA